LLFLIRELIFEILLLAQKILDHIRQLVYLLISHTARIGSILLILRGAVPTECLSRLRSRLVLQLLLRRVRRLDWLRILVACTNTFN